MIKNYINIAWRNLTRQKYFGNQNPIGKTLKIKIDDPYLYTITVLLKIHPRTPVLTLTSRHQPPAWK
jgi:hypothetical protein